VRGLIDPVRLVELYIWVLGAGLLLDGAVMLLVQSGDVRASVLHGITGAALLVVSVLARGGHQIRVVWAAVVFGALYVALGVLGFTIDQPFGLQLGPGDHAFHVVIGLVALVVGGWALRTLSLAPIPSRNAAHPAELRNGQVNRRHVRRRHGKARGRGRR
jgi:hypothetical protein